ncbi:MAG: UvrD-helicase domain-containing protein [Polyangiaceae bacterium]|jgi:DNA helicase-2/ATP-dependent DNA helicase PcrA
MAASPPLNAAQREAVDHGEGPLLVLACAGSGKTRVVTHRIARLVERGVPPRAIVALTFTNKAAGEMRERVGRILVDWGTFSGARDLVVSTFHSFGLMVLSRERQALGGDFTIFDQGDQTALVKQLLRETGADRAYDAQAIVARISSAKTSLAREGDPAPCGRAGDEYDEMAAQILPRYRAALRQYRALDFDDLVCEVVHLWHRDAAALARWQDRFSHILVDEYQDTNHVQLELLRLLSARRMNICAVGDDDQAIYGWRGADVRNILDFERHFPGARVIKLEQNYRSFSPILSVANVVIAKRADAKWRKVLFTDREGGEPVHIAVAPSPEMEAAWVAREIRTLTQRDGTRLGDIAVLYRSNAQSRLLEQELREQGLAHRVFGGTQFFERKEIKDVLAYLKLALNPSDEISLRRVLNYPARGIGETTFERLALYAAERRWSLWQTVERVDVLDDVSRAAREGCRSLVQVVTSARASLLGQRRAPSDVAQEICERIGLERELRASAPTGDAGVKRWGNVQWVFSVLARREKRNGLDRGSDPSEGLSAFLQALTLDFSEAEAEAPDAVTLSTLHASKGLEFAVVFLVGCEEGYLPHARTLDARVTDMAEGAGDIEEERRLFYVGVTRARERLILSRAKARVLRGKSVLRTPSRFIVDIPPELVDEREVGGDAPMTPTEIAAQAAAILKLLSR